MSVWDIYNAHTQHYNCIYVNTYVHMYTCRIRKEYEVIADKALTTPTNTQHLMELKEFMEKAETETLVDLEQRMAVAKHRSGIAKSSECVYMLHKVTLCGCTCMYRVACCTNMVVYVYTAIGDKCIYYV